MSRRSDRLRDALIIGAAALAAVGAVAGSLTSAGGSYPRDHGACTIQTPRCD